VGFWREEAAADHHLAMQPLDLRGGKVGAAGSPEHEGEDHGGGDEEDDDVHEEDAEPLAGPDEPAGAGFGGDQVERVGLDLA
jgi:hypothetical protein